MSLTQGEIDAINSMSKEFQNFNIGTLLGQALNGVQPSGSIGTGEIEDLAVTTAKIANDAVTNAKMGTDEKVGSLAALTTTVKTSLQAAINELVTSISTKLGETSEIKNLLSGTITLNGSNPSPVAFQSDLAATVTSSNAETYDLTGVGDGGTIIINPDGAGNETATVNFAAGNSVSGASPSTDISAGVDNKFNISVRGDAAEEVTLTLVGANSGANIATEMQTQIQALGGNKASVTVDYNVTAAGKYAIVDSVLGTSSTVVITPATLNNVTEELKIGTASGGVETAGTGDVANAAAATAVEIAAVMNGDMTGLTTNGDSGSLVIVSDTTGKDSSLVIGAGTLDAVLGLTNAAEYYGAQGLGFASDMANTNYRVLIIPTGVASASLGSIMLGSNNKATTGFDIECETAASTITVDLFIVGDLA